jgi:two-component system copper resistance phosphate regulon response regulator CusR
VSRSLSQSALTPDAAEPLRVLLIASRKPDALMLARGLQAGGAVVAVVRSLAQGDAAAAAGGTAVIALDLAGREAEALALLGRWRRDGLRAPVLLLTEGGDGASGVRGLDGGADTFLSRPVTPRLLLAHLRALVRTATGRAAAIVRAHDLEIDTAARTVKRGGRLLPLTRREYDLLRLLLKHRGQVVSRLMIRSAIWGPEPDDRRGHTSNVIEVCIRSLRAKIDKCFAQSLILTRWGQGYLLREDDPPEGALRPLR